MLKITKAEYNQSMENLKGWIKDGDTVYTILRRVTKSGENRDIGIVVFVKGQPVHPNFSVAKVLGLPFKTDGVRVNGGGMDMGFSLVYDLGRAMGIKLNQVWL